MRVPVEMRPRPLFEVGAAIAPESCAEVGHGEWAPLLHATSSTLLAHLDNLRPATAELDVYVAAGEPLPVALGATFGPGTPVLSVEQFGWQPEQRERLAARLKADGLPMAGAFTNTRFATRLRVRVDDKGAFSTFFLLLGGIPQFVIGRGFVDAPARPRARLCGVLPAPLRPCPTRAAIPGGVPGAWRRCAIRPGLGPRAADAGREQARGDGAGSRVAAAARGGGGARTW